MNNALISPEAAAFHRLSAEGANSQAINQARETSMTQAEFRLAVSLSGLRT
jgi:hypothetical protein